jgi:hypothetical protein
MYTAAELRRELIAKHGAKLRFLFDEIDKRGLDFKVEDLRLRRFDGTKKGAYIDDGAPDIATATDWALDALREWAGESIRISTPGRLQAGLFAEISREWAKNGEGKFNAPAFLGTTIDWLYLFSATSSGSPNGDMYPLFMRVSVVNDLFDLYCWIFSDKWNAISGTKADAKVNIASHTGLARRYWDKDGPQADQTHHFAAYFWWGANFGTNWWLLKKALADTGDYDTAAEVATNPGDVELGKVAARWGSYMKDRPGYIGKMVEDDLRH